MLRDLHDDLDRAVAEAYGWPADLAAEDILYRLVELNAARAAEERTGLVRWLRPEFQKLSVTQAGLGMEMEDPDLMPGRAMRAAWPASLSERVRAVRDHLMRTHGPVTAEMVARSFLRGRVSDVSAILETLTAIGQAKYGDRGYWI